MTHGATPPLCRRGAFATAGRPPWRGANLGDGMSAWQKALTAGFVAAMISAAPAWAQGDPLAPPSDLGASGVPVPPDGTAILGTAAPAGEIAIPVPPSTCPGLQAMMRSQGVVLLPTGGGNAQRYVRDQAYCDSGQEANPAWVPTSDNPQCFIGYTCAEPNDDGDN